MPYVITFTVTLSIRKPIRYGQTNGRGEGIRFDRFSNPASRQSSLDDFE